MAVNRSRGRDVHIYDAKDRVTLLGGLILTNGVTKANFHSMVEIFLLFESPFSIQFETTATLETNDDSLSREKYATLERNDEPLSPGNYYVVGKSLILILILMRLLIDSLQDYSPSTMSLFSHALIHWIRAVVFSHSARKFVSETKDVLLQER